MFKQTSQQALVQKKGIVFKSSTYSLKMLDRHHTLSLQLLQGFRKQIKFNMRMPLLLITNVCYRHFMALKEILLIINAEGGQSFSGQSFRTKCSTMDKSELGEAQQPCSHSSFIDLMRLQTGLSMFIMRRK